MVKLNQKTINKINIFSVIYIKMKKKNKFSSAQLRNNQLLLPFFFFFFFFFLVRFASMYEFVSIPCNWYENKRLLSFFIVFQDWFYFHVSKIFTLEKQKKKGGMRMKRVPSHCFHFGFLNSLLKFMQDYIGTSCNLFHYSLTFFVLTIPSHMS